MFGQRQQRGCRSKFATRSVLIKPPEPKPVVYDEAEYEDEIEPVVIKPKTKKGRLPGVKLLRQLARERHNANSNRVIEDLMCDLAVSDDDDSM